MSASIHEFDHHTTDKPLPRFTEIDLGAFRQAMFGFTRKGASIIEKTVNNCTKFYNDKGIEIARTFRHKRRMQCQAGRLQPFVVEAAKSNVKFDLVEK